jgi:hypothetical protein
MSRRPPTFRQRDLTAAIKGARAAGCTVSHVEIDPVSGKITVMIGVGAATQSVTDLDMWLSRHAD